LPKNKKTALQLIVKEMDLSISLRFLTMVL